MGEGVSLVREPDAGDLHVRFDERRLETARRTRTEAPARRSTATPRIAPVPRQSSTLNVRNLHGSGKRLSGKARSGLQPALVARRPRSRDHGLQAFPTCMRRFRITDRLHRGRPKRAPRARQPREIHSVPRPVGSVQNEARATRR